MCLPSHWLTRLIQARDDMGLPISGYISSLTPFMHIPAFLLTLSHYTISANSNQQLFQAPQTENILRLSIRVLTEARVNTLPAVVEIHISNTDTYQYSHSYSILKTFFLDLIFPFCCWLISLLTWITNILERVARPRCFCFSDTFLNPL